VARAVLDGCVHRARQRWRREAAITIAPQGSTEDTNDYRNFICASCALLWRLLVCVYLRLIR
jgi:hypothetical protein